jgi:hypothetical protein
MSPANCERYLEEPEANAAHLRECESCRALFGTLEERVDARPVAVPDLPVAPWEGASHRAWGTVIGVALAVTAAALALFVASGTSSMTGIIDALTAAVPQLSALVALFRSAGNTPGPWPMVIVAAFFIVNALLFLLLRRAPRGIDG